MEAWGGGESQYWWWGSTFHSKMGPHFHKICSCWCKFGLKDLQKVRNFALKVLNLDRCSEKLKQVPISQSWIPSTAQSSFMQTQQLACLLHSKIKRYSLHSKIKVLYDSLSWIMSSVGPLHHKIWLPESRPKPELVKLQPQLNDRVIPFLLICLKKGQEPGLTAKEPRPTKEPRPK